MSRKVSKILKEARLAKGFSTASDFARAEGLPIQTYIADENGAREPNRKRMFTYAKALDIDWTSQGFPDFDPLLRDGPNRMPLVNIPVVGACAKGAWKLEPRFTRGDEYEILVPRFPAMGVSGTSSFLGLEIQDSSSPYPQGSIVIYAPYISLRRAMESGDKVIFVRQRGKELEQTAQEVTYRNGKWLVGSAAVTDGMVTGKIVAVWSVMPY